MQDKQDNAARLDQVLPAKFRFLVKLLKSEGVSTCRRCAQVIPADAGELAHRWRVCPGCDERLRAVETRGSSPAGRNRRARYAAMLHRRIDVVIPAAFRYARLRSLSESLRKALLSRTRGQGLLLWGAVGTGKSHAMAALVRAAVIQTRGEIRVERAVYDRLVLDLRNCFKPGATKSELDILRPYLDADIFWLDDLGATESLRAAATDFQVRTVQTLLNDRLERNVTTFITTNLSIENLQSLFDERIASRLHTFKIIELRGADRRKDGVS